MNNSSRTHNSIVNLVITLGCQFVAVLLGFVVRTFFINKFGTDYLGINGLYTNILTVLSLAELGVGSAIGFSLYKPVACGDEDKIAALMSFYKKAYYIISATVAVVGLILVPFLDDLITSDREIEHLRLYYILFLSNSALSYLLAYKATLLYVDQKNYIVKICHTVFLILQDASQLAVLFVFRNYAAFIVVQIICTLLNNLCVSIIVDKKYSFIKTNKTKLDKKEQKNVFKNIRAMIVYKIGGVIVNNTDNILISKIINITSTGLYSNYTLIVNSVAGVIDMICVSAVGSIGNYNAQAKPSDSQKLFEAVSFFDYWIYGFATVAFYCLLDDFIVIWLSTSKYLLDSATLIAIVLSTLVMGLSASTSTFRNTTGLFKETKYIFLFTAILNLILSIILGIKIGLCGILFATSISKLLTNFWYEPYRLYKDFFHMSCIPHFLKRGLMVILVVVSCAIVEFIFTFIPYLNKATFLLEAAIVAVVPNLIFLLVYRKTDEFKFIAARLKPAMKKKLNKVLHR